MSLMNAQAAKYSPLMFIFNPVNTEVVNINRRLDVCVALVKIKFQKNNIGVISVFGISNT